MKILKIHENRQIHFIRKKRTPPVHLSANYSITFRHYYHTKQQNKLSSQFETII